QDRPELKELCSWWRQGTGGMCALVGMGGAGKSAITSTLLSMLPEVMEDSPTFSKDWTLPKPTALFVFSFSDNPDPAYFFNALVAWLDPQRDPSTTRVGQTPISTSSFRAIQLLANCSDVLLILDELEHMQDADHSSDNSGRIVEPGNQKVVS